MDEHRVPPLHGEPSVEELLDDPILTLLLAYDGISVDRVRAAVADAQAKLQTGVRHEQAA
ncbi:MAG: hypothetical protein ACREDZ_02700 [Kiloniellales bacterium]